MNTFITFNLNNDKTYILRKPKQEEIELAIYILEKD